jgi:hypothetical protein
MRATDDTVTPEAVARQEAARDEAKLKRVRLWVGVGGAVLCGLAFLVGLVRDNNVMVFGAFLGGLVAGNVVPLSEVAKFIPTRGGS